ncbi:MAG: hypothetical protein JXR37_03095, partial [Kiritimatiellae bacterium]|nr:hypothetical protein [Kiritimatiellia bacterium]
YAFPETFTGSDTTVSISVTVDLCNGIICGNNPVNFSDAFGLCKAKTDAPQWPPYLSEREKRILEKYGATLVAGKGDPSVNCVGYTFQQLGEEKPKGPWLDQGVLEQANLYRVDTRPETGAVLMLQYSGSNLVAGHMGLVVPGGTENQRGSSGDVFFFPASTVENIMREIQRAPVTAQWYEHRPD